MDAATLQNHFGALMVRVVTLESALKAAAAQHDADTKRIAELEAEVAKTKPPEAQP